MDDDSALIDESNIDPLQPLEAVLGEVFHSAPVDQDTGPQQAAPANQQPHDDGDHLEPWERQQLERDLHSAVRQGRVDLAAQAKAKLLGIGPFDPGTYGLRRTTALADVGAPEEGGFGPYFKMNRGHMDNPDLERVAERYALERYDDPRRARTLSGPDLDTVHSQYAQYVADNRVGKYEVFEGNGNTSWAEGGPRLTVYTPDGDYGIGSPTAEAMQALHDAGYQQLPNYTPAPH